jgi:hypothetical protein
METAKTVSALPFIDEHGNQLIPRDELPFIPGGLNGLWRVPVPADFSDAHLLGQQMALKLLRAAPDAAPGEQDRQAALGWLAGAVFGAQLDWLEKVPQAKRHYAKSLLSAFWSTVTRFAEPAATLRNVEFWSGVCERKRADEVRFMAQCDEAAKRERSTRARAAALAGWAKRRKSAKRGKAVRS